jgi:prephenate dehydrogenase
MLLSEATVAIVGLGLMGGSLGKALVHTGASKEVRALGRRADFARTAKAHGAAHVAGVDPQEILGDADLVVFATPVRTIEHQIRELHPFMKTGAVVTDMGSVKGPIVEAMEQLPLEIAAVAGHPMCGKEVSGLEVADATLFEGKTWAVVPTKNTNSRAMNLVTQLVTTTGARMVLMSPEDHDESVAGASHLPYLLASTLVSVAEALGRDQPGVWELASSGFRDTSRVAGGDLTMMLDIIASNSTNIVRALGQAQQHMSALIELIANQDEEGLRKLLSKARERRIGMFTDHCQTLPGMDSHE